MESFKFFILVLQDSYAQTSVSTVRDRLKTPQCLCLTVKVRELPSSISVYLCGRTRRFAWQGEVVSPIVHIVGIVVRVIWRGNDYTGLVNVYFT